MSNKPLMPVVWALDEAERRHYSPTDGYILTKLANMMKLGGAWPSVPKLAQRCNCSERHVRRALALFRRDRLIAIEYGTGRGNTSTYRLLANGVANGRPVNGEDLFPDTLGASQTSKGDSMSPFHTPALIVKGDSECKKRGTQSPPESTKKNPPRLVPTSSGAASLAPLNGADGQSSSDPKKVLFDVGRPVLRQLTGQTHGAASRQIGAWLRDHANQDATVVFAAIKAAEREAPYEPIPWITAAIKARVSPKSAPTAELRQRWGLGSFLHPTGETAK